MEGRINVSFPAGTVFYNTPAPEPRPSLGQVLETIKAIDEAFEPLERGGYHAHQMTEAMQQMRKAINDLAGCLATVGRAAP